MTVEYFAKTAYQADGPVGLAKVVDSERGLFAWFLNRDGDWQMDNTLPAAMSGIGGDNDWHQIDEEAARGIVAEWGEDIEQLF